MSAVSRSALAVFVALLALPPSALAGWNQPVGGASPINHADHQGALDPNLTTVGGVPHVAWQEDDGVNWEVRVSRLNATGTAWEEVVGGASPINHANNQNAFDIGLAAVGGVPHVAWREHDGVNWEVRVSRLNATGTAWEQLVGGASPINHANNRSALQPSLTSIGGVPQVAWIETDGTNYELRVSRLNGAGTGWEQLVGGASPINHASNRSAAAPSLTAIGGVPHVAWRELDGITYVLRVSRLNAAGSAWEQVVGGASPINHDGTRHALEPSLAAIGGVPHVAWHEADGTNEELRVARLEPEFGGSAALPTDTGALLLTQATTFGTSFPVGFEYGAGFGSSTATTDTHGDTDTVVQTVAGLTPATAYSARPFATAGTPQPRVTGGSFAFTTAAQNGPGATGPAGPTGDTRPTGPTGQTGPTGSQGEPAIKLLLALAADRLKMRSGKKLKAKYVITSAAALTLEIYKRRGKRPLARKNGTANELGRHKIKWNGKIKRKRAKPGRYRLALTATGADQQTATDQIPLRIRKPRKR